MDLAKYDGMYGMYHNPSIAVAIDEEFAWKRIFRAELSRRKQRLTIQLTLPRRNLEMPLRSLACDVIASLTDHGQFCNRQTLASSLGLFLFADACEKLDDGHTVDILELVVCELVNLARCAIATRSRWLIQTKHGSFC